MRRRAIASAGSWLWIGKYLSTLAAEQLLREYEVIWQGWREYAEKHADSPTLYKEEGFRYTPGEGASGDEKHGVGALAGKLAKKLAKTTK